MGSLTTHNRPRVYIASPLAGVKGLNDEYENVVQHLHRAYAVANRLLHHGYAPFVPHYSHYWNLIYPTSRQMWLEYDRCWLIVSDAVLRLPGASPGADLEVLWASDAGIPVFYAEADLCRALPGKGTNDVTEI